MPCATLHLILAGRVVDAWRQSPRRAPVRMDRPENVQAFLHGALAPDMGFVPGTDRLVSDAVHYLRPGDFTRRLLTLARTEQQEAFAWGWATHVLADVQIHPLVGRAVGERLFGDRNRRVDAIVDVAAHVSLEVGLDIALLREGIGLPAPPAQAYLRDASGVRHLAEALAETYGVDWDPVGLMQHHRRAVELTRWWPRALSLLPLQPSGSFTLGALPGGRDDGFGRPEGAPEAVGAVAEPQGDRGMAYHDDQERGRPVWQFRRSSDRGVIRRSVVRLLRRMAGEGSAAWGFFGPEAPRRWFMLEVLERAGDFVGSFQELVDDGFEGMGNMNLETGALAGEGRGHPATDLVARELATLRRVRTSIVR